MPLFCILGVHLIITPCHRAQNDSCRQFVYLHNLVATRQHLSGRSTYDCHGAGIRLERRLEEYLPLEFVRVASASRSPYLQVDPIEGTELYFDGEEGALNQFVVLLYQYVPTRIHQVSAAAVVATYSDTTRAVYKAAKSRQEICVVESIVITTVEKT